MPEEYNTQPNKTFNAGTVSMGLLMGVPTVSALALGTYRHKGSASQVMNTFGKYKNMANVMQEVATQNLVGSKGYGKGYIE